jgi:hypothetical protein
MPKTWILLGKTGVESIWMRIYLQLNFFTGGVADFRGGMVDLNVVNGWTICGEMRG